MTIQGAAQEPSASVSARAFWVIVGASALVALLEVVFRPLWRDEYWALFFSDPNVSLWNIISDRQRFDTHPPLYFLYLYNLRSVFDSSAIIRILNIAFMFFSSHIVWKTWVGSKRQAALYILICVSSYWAIFFAAEIRPYAFIFGASMVGLVLARRLAEGVPDWRLLAGWAIVTGLLGLLHYFAAAWAGFVGLFAIASALRRRQYRDAFKITFATGLGLLLPLLWVIYALPTISFSSDHGDGTTVYSLEFLSELHYSINQFLRALVVKTMFSNIAFLILFALGVRTYFRNGLGKDLLLYYASIALVVLVFTLHLFVTPMIKERAFIIIVPTVFFFMMRSMESAAETPFVRRMWGLVPMFALISMVLFSTQYFKDREGLRDVQTAYREVGECADEPVIAYLRDFQHPEFYPYLTRLALAGQRRAGEVVLLSAKEITQAGGLTDVPSGSCRLRAVAIGLSRGDETMREAAREALVSAGLDLTNLEERQYAGGRHLLFVEPEFVP